MKVAHIVSTFPPYRAGIGNAAYHFSWELSQLGHQITVYTPSHEHFHDMDESLPFRVKRLRPLLSYGNAGVIPQLLWRVRGFDVVHLHYPFFGGAEIVYMLDRIQPLHMILHYHMDVVGEGMLRAMFKFHTRFIMPRIIDRAQRVIVTTMDYARDSNIRHLVERNPDKFIEIPLGVNADIFKPRIAPPDLIKKHSLQNKKIVLFVGALDRAHYFKGINYLIKAFQLISSNDDYRLVIVGGGNLKSSYESIVTNFGLERKVTFAGFVSDDMLPLYYNLASLFVLPSVDSSEAFGIALLEAMASGLPVITTDLPGLRRVVDRSVTGVLIKPRQVDALAKHILYFLKNPHISSTFGHAGRERVLKKYTWERVGKETSDLYSSVA